MDKSVTRMNMSLCGCQEGNNVVGAEGFGKKIDHFFLFLVLIYFDF